LRQVLQRLCQFLKGAEFIFYLIDLYGFLFFIDFF